MKYKRITEEFGSVGRCIKSLKLNNLRHANLSGANLRGADLSGADLRGADLRGADLRGADLRGADLRGANLSGANLRGADLSGANLRHANLSGANLRGADLSGADLDFSVFPLWCGGFDMVVDDKLVSQLLYHIMRMQGESKSLNKIKSLKRLKKIANNFHRADECGEIK